MFRRKTLDARRTQKNRSSANRRRLRSELRTRNVALGLEKLEDRQLLAADSVGTEFWLTFQRNFDNTGVTPTLFITGAIETTGNVEIPGLGYSQTFNVTPGSVTTVALPATSTVTTADGIANLGIRVTSGEEVAVYGLNRRAFSTDAFVGLPADILATEYMVLSYPSVSGVNNASQFAVVAIENNTVITVTPSSATTSRPVGVPYNVTLQAGDVYQLAATTSGRDLSGTQIISNKPVAVFGGNSCAQVPVGTSFCDHLVEQLPPVVTWGRNFVTVPLALRTGGDVFRVLSSENGNEVKVDGAVVATLNRGKFYDVRRSTPLVIETSAPSLVAQYSTGRLLDNTTGDPFMSIVPPVEQLLFDYTLATPLTGFNSHFVNVWVPSQSTASVRVDGNPVNPGLFFPIGDSGFSGAKIPIAAGTHNVQADAPLGAMIYGFTNNDSYGYTGGSSLVPIGNIHSVSLSSEASGFVTTEREVTATVLDINGLPVFGSRVEFVVQGSNPRTGIAFTRFNGQAIFRYTGTNPGQDTITSKAASITSPPLVIDWKPIPDLVISNPSAPAISRPGSVIDIGWSVSNDSNAPATFNWTDRVFLSSDNVLDGADLLLASVPTINTVPLAPGGAYTRNPQISIPVNVAVGNYYILVQANSDSSQIESSRLNNTVARPIQLSLPDLRLAAAPLVATAVPVFGSSVNVQWSVENVGGIAAISSARDRVWLSTDNVLSVNDVSLGTFDILSNLPLAVNGSYTVNGSITLPLTSSLNSGTYYVIVQSDSTGAEAELNEANNWQASVPITIALPPLPDLVVSSIQVPPEGISGRAIQYSWTVTNQGAAAATGTWADRVWLSTDAQVGSDVQIGNFSFTGTLRPGESITRIQNYTLPIDMEGNRWFVVHTDHGDQIFEHTNSNNNIRISDTPMAVALAPFPNLKVTAVTPPAEAFSSQQTLVQWTVTNTGTGATSAPVWQDRVWLSTDDVLDAQDINLGQFTNPSYLNPGESYLNSLTVTLPQGVQGDYWFIVQSDASNAVYEHVNENDNVGVGPKTRVILTPPPDLRVTNISAPDLAFSNQRINVSWTVKNDDATPGAGGRTLQTTWYDTVYLSSSPSSLVTPVILGSFWRTGALESGESYTQNQSLTIPVNIEGDWYIFVHTDRGNHVFEHIFEGNNLEVRRNEAQQPRQTSITLTPPDLEVDFVQAPSNANSSNSLSFTYQVTNYGVAATPTPSWRDSYYLSANPTLDGSDILLGSQAHSGVLDVFGSVNDSYTRTATFSLPNGLVGAFYVLVVTDSNNAVFEGPSGSLGESNNVTSSTAPVNIVSNPPDLVIAPDSFEIPLSGPVQSGHFVRASWTVLNQGLASTGGNWIDRVYISIDGVVGGADDRLVATVIRSGNLDAAGTYSVMDQQINIPIDLDGQVYLYVRTDAMNAVYEGANENNNVSGLIPVSLIRDLSDLQVVSIAPLQGPIRAGELVTVSWTVQNFGSGPTNVLSWRDRIYLSSDNILSGSSDILLGSSIRSNPLVAGGSYTQTAQVRIPTGAVGPFYLGIWSDADNQVFEGLLEGNNTRLRGIGTDQGDPDDPGPVQPPAPGNNPIPDLVLVNVDAPTEAYSGQSFNLTWTVRNDGDPTPRSWFDQVYLSLDQVLDLNSDVSLGHVSQSSLGTGASYTKTQSFSIPRGLSGPFYVFVAADRGNQLGEPNELDNIDFDRGSMMINLLPPADFVVGTIDVPANTSPGMSASITYTVKNEGTESAIGTWFDSLYISADPTWDINDSLFARVRRDGPLAGGASYTQTATELLPGLIPGQYHVIIRSDILNQIPESNETNNLEVSLNKAVVDLALLPLGAPQTGNLSQGRAVYYKTQVLTAGETVRFTLDGAEEAFSELYVRYGEMPTRNRYDFAANQPFVSDLQIVLPVEQAGVYYVMAIGTVASGAPAYTISANIIPFSVLDVQAGRVGNLGNATLKISGARFAEDTEFFVIDDQSKALSSERVYLQDSATAYVTFDLYQVPPDVYTIGAYDPGQDRMVLLGDALTVIAGSGYNVDTVGTGPEVVAPNRNYRFDVLFGNDGDRDAMAPLLIATSGTSTPMGFSPSELRSGGLLQILGTPEDGPLDILRPGSLNTASIFYRSGSAALGVDVRVESFTHDDRTLITEEQWEQIEASVKPESIEDEDWNRFWSNFPPRIGTTWGHYVQFLNRLAVELSEPGKPLRDVRGMMEMIYETNPNYRPASIASGRLLHPVNGNPIAGVEVGIYGIEDGQSYLAARAFSDDEGRFQLSPLQAGQYTLMLNARDFDLNRDGTADDNPPSVVVSIESDLTIGDLFLYNPAPAPPPFESGASLATDSQGRTHIAWLRENAVWHAYWNGTDWVNGVPVSAAPGSNITIRTATNLIDGSAEGVLLSWIESGGNEAEVFYSIGRARLGGGFEWSLPMNLTQDVVEDSGLDAVVLSDGRVLVTVSKQNAEIQDDADGYYYVLDIEADQLTWPTDILDALLNQGGTPDAALSPADASWKVEFDESFDLQELSKGAIFGIDSLLGNVKGNIKGSAELSGDTITLGASIGMSIEAENRYVNLVFSGNGSASGSWVANKITCEWDPQKSSLGFGGEISVDIKNALSGALKWFGPQGFAAATGYEYAVALASRFSGGKLQIENGLVLGYSIDVGVDWDNEVPFPDWLLPDRGTITHTARAAPYVSAQWGDGEFFNINVEGLLEGSLVGSFPAQPNDGASGTFGFSVTVQLGWFSFSGSWSGALGSSSLDEADAALFNSDLPLAFSYNPAGNLGSTNTYGSNTILATANTDVVSDGAMSVAIGTDGKVFGSWARSVNPSSTQMGSEVYVAEFLGTTWGTPVVIPGSIGINRGVQTTVDQLGRPMVLWSRSDSSQISSSTTEEDLLEYIDDSELYYSILDNGQWSTPNAVASTAGVDGQPSVSKSVDGRLLAAWQSSGTEVDSVFHAIWDGSSWDYRGLPITAGIVGDVTVSRVGTRDVVFWSESIDADGSVRNSHINYSSLESAGWSSPVLFVPGEIANQMLANSPPGLQLAGIPLPPVPEELCECDKVNVEYRGSDQGCGFTVEYDEVNCKKIIIYKPCVPPPVDPNDILGPVGVGDENWIPADQQLDYMIRFENDPVFAQAPAQKVVVTQQLDADLDFRTFRLSDFGFGGLVFQVPANRAFYSTRLDLTEDRGFFVDFTAGIDVQTGVVTWTLVTIDPLTGEQPLDPLVGFLAINDSEGAGEGYLNYSIRAKRTASTGDVVDAEARIVFDTEAPIDTPPIFNTLDAVKPTSAVSLLPAVADGNAFTVSWSGSDDTNGSGLVAFNIFVSENDGPYTPWLQGTQLTEAEFVGVEGSRYTFYSVAFDNSGHQEATPEVPDAQTLTPGGVASIGDRVWLDRNNNGIQDDGEVGVEGVTVRLYYSDSTEPIDQAVTDANGLYSFPDRLLTQNYFLEFVAPAGFAFAQPNVGSDDGLDSDVAILDGRTSPFSILGGLNNQWDAGLVQLSVVSGKVWWDVTGNGSQEPNEPNMPSQVVYIDLNDNGAKDSNEPQAVTDGTGAFSFGKLRPGLYTIRYVVQDGWEQTYPGAAGVSETSFTGSSMSLFTPGITSFPGVVPSMLKHRLDVNGDGLVTRIDALLVIMELNAQSTQRSLQDSSALFRVGLDHATDVSGDGLITPLDVLLVLNAINGGFTSLQSSDSPAVEPLSRSSENSSSSARGLMSNNAANWAGDLVGLRQLRSDSRYVGLDGRGLAVVVIDTGIDSDHTFFGPDSDGDGVADRIVYQYDFADGDANASDRTGHGSHVTSVIASGNANYLGIAPGVDIISLKVFSDSGVGSFANLERALQWVIANTNAYNIAAVNLSLGDGKNWSSSVGLYGISDELSVLDSLGVITVSAAGNSFASFDGRQGLAYPAADPNSLSVGAVWDGDRGFQTFGIYGTDYTTGADRLTSFSQRHANGLDTLAPGAMITAANATGGVTTMRGTSMATPFVTGAAVLAQQLALQEFGQRLTTSQMKQLLAQSGMVVFDGDDENANVRSTQAQYRRLDLVRLMESVRELDPDASGGDDPGDDDGQGVDIGVAGGSGAYQINLQSGQDRLDINFGTRRLDGLADVTLPISAVQALPLHATSLSIPISVVGSDPAGVEGPASGVKEYDLFVATGSQAFTKFATVPASNPNSVFVASSDNVYYFRSVARDYQGNEEIDTGADVFIRVGDFDKPVSQVDDATAGTNGLFTIAVSGTDRQRIERFDYYVVIDDALPATMIGSSNTTHGVGANYTGSLVYQGIVDGAEHKYRFYSRAVDSAANVEEAPTVGDKEVLITFSSVPALQATGIDVQLGATQRSYLRYVDVLFADAAGLANLVTQPNRIRAERFTLNDQSARDLNTAGQVVTATVAQVGTSNRLRLDFGTEGIGSGGVLGARNTVAGDGFYRVRVDSNNDGDFIDAGETLEFYRLLGDADASRLVDAGDTALVDTLFGRSGFNLDGDLNSDGVVNSADRALTQRNYRGRSLAAELQQLLDD